VKRAAFVLAGLLVVVLSGTITWFVMDYREGRGGVDQVVAGLQSLAGQRDKIFGPAIPVGPVDLDALRRANVSVPTIFVKNNELATPWERFQINKAGTTMTLDLYNTPPAACKSIMINADKYPGLVRIASSSRGADERVPPVSEADAAAGCRETAPIVRLILGP
jgi:hypothetical protein